MRQEVELILLPTKDKTHITKVSTGSGDIMIYNEMPIGVENRFGDGVIPLHLYATVPQEVEPIKKGDYFWNPVHNDISIARKDGMAKDLRKVIITTDPKLINKRASGEQWPEWDYDVSQFEQSFIKKFCDLGGIDKISVVYTEKCQVERGDCCCSQQDIDCQCSGLELNKTAQGTVIAYYSLNEPNKTKQEENKYTEQDMQDAYTAGKAYQIEYEESEQTYNKMSGFQKPNKGIVFKDWLKLNYEK